MEPSLIPNDLLKEILRWELSGLPYGHGLFKTTWEKCPDILGNICEKRLHYAHGPLGSGSDRTAGKRIVSWACERRLYYAHGPLGSGSDRTAGKRIVSWALSVDRTALQWQLSMVRTEIVLHLFMPHNGVNFSQVVQGERMRQ